MVGQPHPSGVPSGYISTSETTSHEWKTISRSKALLLLDSNPCNTYLALTPQSLYARSPILYFPSEEQWLPSTLLKPGLPLEKSLFQGLSQQPCPTKKLYKIVSFLKSQTKKRLSPEWRLISISRQKPVLNFLALQ